MIIIVRTIFNVQITFFVDGAPPCMKLQLTFTQLLTSNINQYSSHIFSEGSLYFALSMNNLSVILFRHTCRPS